MRKEILVHTIFFVSLFLFVSAFKNFLQITFFPFWIGGLIGTLLPDIDHLIYVYFLRPSELTSLRTQSLLAKREIFATLNLLSITRSERKHLIFHTFTFQVIFVLFSFFVISSSGSLLGRGLVIAFLLHLLLDQFIDFLSLGHIQNWFGQINFIFDRQKTKIYLFVQLGILLLLGFIF